MLTDVMVYSSVKKIHYGSAVKDTCCGVYPLFYYVQGDYVVVSSSAADLIKHKGTFKENKEISLIGGNWPSHPDSHDIEVKRVLPLHYAHSKLQKQVLEPTPRIKTMTEYVELQARYIQKWVNSVEREYGPETFHVVLTGGKDSLIILLVNKIYPNMWLSYSGEPNASIVQEFINLNVPGTVLVRDDGVDDETPEFIKQKIIATDGLVNPTDYRYFQRLGTVVSELGKVVFWTGTWGDALNSNTIWKKGIKTDKEYWNFFYTRGSRWQGAYHQAFRNLYNVPCFSVYHSPELWKKVYLRMNPEFCKNYDLREVLGEAIAKRNILWPSKNPGPKPYSKQHMTLEQIKEIYIGGLK